MWIKGDTMRRPGTRRHRIILAVIFAGISLGILQGLPETLQALADCLGLN